MKTVLMIGSGRGVRGGISSLVNNYYDTDLVKKINLIYIESHVEGRKAAKFIKFAEGMFKFFYYLVRNDVKIVHVHSASRASFYRKSMFLIAAKVLGKRSVFHLHGGEFKIFYYIECGPIRRFYIRTIIKIADVVLCLSAEWNEIISKIIGNGKNVVTLYNCVKVPDLKKNHQDKNEISVLYMGKLDKGKGVFDLVDAAALLENDKKQIRYILCGVGEQKALKRKIKLLGISKKFEFPGWIHDKSKYFLLGDIFVLPSYNEGLPMVLIEASSYGLPLISTKVGGISEVLFDGKNGYFIAPGDIENLKDKIDILAESTELRTIMGCEGVSVVNAKFSCHKIVNKLESIYKQLS